jgi:hypothetical protein
MGCGCGKRSYEPLTSNVINARQNENDGVESAAIGPERDALIAAANDRASKKSDRRPSGR